MSLSSDLVHGFDVIGRLCQLSSDQRAVGGRSGEYQVGVDRHLATGALLSGSGG